MVVAALGFNNFPVATVSILLMSCHQSTFWCSNDFISQTSVNLTKNPSHFFMEKDHIVKIIFSGLKSSFLFLYVLIYM